LPFGKQWHTAMNNAVKRARPPEMALEPSTMSQQPHSTGYARLTPIQARLVLLALLLLSAFCVAVTLSPIALGRIGKPRLGAGDVALYRAEVDRIHAGQGYYQAASAELLARGYPTRSVFNWRLPLPIWLIGKLPAPPHRSAAGVAAPQQWSLGKVLLCLLALAVILTAFAALAREGNLWPALGCSLLLTGPLMLCVLGDIFVMPVLWAGVLLTLSIGAYGAGRPYCGVVIGLAAAFCRELALPYCLLCAAIAWRHQRRRELAAWAVGLAAWAAYFALHWLRVANLITPDARAHPEGWLAFHGTSLVLCMVQMNPYLLLLPQWVAALYFAAAMFGFAGWHTPLGVRAGLTAALFVAAFGIVGQEFNQYWGTLLAPLLCFGFVRLPQSLWDLLRAATLKGQPARCRTA
jgi:hypothetical protein